MSKLFNTFRLGLVVATLFLFQEVKAQTILRVNENSPCTSGCDGSTWALAYNDLQSALAAASGITEIWVAEGTYKPTAGTDRSISFVMKNGLSLYGGFPNTGNPGFGDRDWRMYPSILSGEIGNPGPEDNSYRIVYIDHAAATTHLDGFTISGANGEGTRNGGGIYNDGSGVGRLSNPRIANCSITGNIARSGAGLFNDGLRGNSSPQLVNCIFSNNKATRDGGGAYNFGGNSGNSSPQFINCIFSGNKAERIGGAAFNDAVDAVGGTSNPVFSNCSFSGNTADFGVGAVYNDAFNGVCAPQFNNCILWGNAGELDNRNATPVVSYSIVQGGYTGTGNLNVDPLFVQQPPVGLGTTGDLRLLPCSPAIDAGNDAATPPGVTTDPDGNARQTDVYPGGAQVDMGAYEALAGDTQPPVMSCPANRIVCGDPATNKWTGMGLAPLALSDNCGTPALEYRLNSQAFQPGNANERSFNSGATTVTYRATDNAGLTASCSFTVTVRSTPNASWSQTALSICNGASINLASYARDSRSAAKRYNFYSGDANGGNLQFLGTVTASNGSVNFGQNRMVLPAGNNSTPTLHYYYVEGINTFTNGPNCTGSLSAALVVTVNPLPMLTANVLPAGQICPGNAVNISFISSIPATIFWSNSNTGIGLAANGTGNISFNAAAPGMATIFSQASSGACGSAPLSIPLTVSSCSNSRMLNAGADPFGGAGAPQLYPNPSNGQLFLRLPEGNSPVLYATRIEFFDAAGRRVWSESFELAGGAERRLDLSRLPAGVYGWTLRVGDAGYHGRVVKE